MMAKTSDYRLVVVETFLDPSRPSDGPIHARPIEGQGLDTRMVVECSRAMREQHAVGTKLRIKAKITDREGSFPFLYSHFSWSYEVIE